MGEGRRGRKERRKKVKEEEKEDHEENKRHTHEPLIAVSRFYATQQS